MNPKEQAYDAAGEALVDWVDTHKDTVEGPLLCTLLLEKAIDVCFFCLGTDQTMKAVDAMMREKIREYAKDSSNN
jgi:hypothetical protein|tara:strand:+ start:95 stop:319 length:225 start_codon:yes stop_codon:yes gene_type:complete